MHISEESRFKQFSTRASEKKNIPLPPFWQTWGYPHILTTKHAIAHNKIIVIDGKTVITGSFNFTKAAEEKNAENLLIIKSTELAKIYMTIGQSTKSIPKSIREEFSSHEKADAVLTRNDPTILSIFVTSLSLPVVHPKCLGP